MLSSQGDLVFRSILNYTIRQQAGRQAFRRPIRRYPKIDYTDRFLELKWCELADVPIDDDDPDEPDGVLGADWFVFKKGEPRIEGVWRWFDSHYTAGLGALMFGTAE